MPPGKYERGRHLATWENKKSEPNPGSLLILSPAHHLCVLLQIFLQPDLLLVGGLQRRLQLLQLRRKQTPLHSNTEDVG